jgi:hypothetical protein
MGRKKTDEERFVEAVRNIGIERAEAVLKLVKAALSSGSKGTKLRKKAGEIDKVEVKSGPKIEAHSLTR